MKAKTQAAVLVLRNPKDGLATLTVEYKDPERQFKRVSTGIKVVPGKWDPTTDTIKAGGSQDPATDTQTARTKLAEVNAVITDLQRTLKRWPYVSELNAAKVTQAAPKPSELTVSDALRNFMDSEGHKWAPATRKNHVTLLNNLSAYEAANKTTWVAANLTNEDVTQFQKWLRVTYNYENSTLRKRLMMLKKLLKHIADTQPLKLKFAKISPLHTLADKPVFTLRLTELETIMGLNLPPAGYLERTRDLLVLQMMCGLRWGDIMQLRSDHITPEGIRIYMEKTQQWVSAPLLEPGRAIIRKYTDEKGLLALPVRSDVKQNKYLKELAQLVPAFDRLVTVINDKGPKVVQHSVPAWQLVTTHTARKSLVTCALDMGVARHHVKAMSGHKTEAAFSRYVNPHAELGSAIAKFNEELSARLKM
ncbi:hypothetical protein DNI29_04990 [Hymenobacter sediminis]|uniref:hypothetical protein n=1 Tax=Hymenobacter sediminis TaxID=2218621 RepID=UPI000DA6D7EF|nr:hypothetical protein [Hymenobacter sediminis]RPD50155.1 hypothetical protein DNI29_04990 [Hymenobacter sediminis]